MKIYDADGTTSHDLALGTSYRNASNAWVPNANWPSTVTQWGGEVASQSEGVQALSLPLPASAQSDPTYVLDKTGDQTMGSKAAVLIVDGVAQDAAGRRSPRPTLTRTATCRTA